MKKSVIYRIADPAEGGGAVAFEKKVLDGVEALNKKIVELETGRKASEEDIKQLKQAANEAKELLVRFQRDQAARKALGIRRPGFVSDDCARHLGCIAIAAAERQGRLEALGNSVQRTNLLAISKEVLGVDVRTALSSTDIPLPTGYSGEVVELVSQYGTARQYGTVYPLGNGVLNLPRLKTSPAFTLLSIATAVTEKSPQTEWVTFTAEKYGGMVRLPSEIEEDSVVALGQFIARYAAREMAAVEDKLFWAGNGTTDGDPEGLTISTITNSKVLQMASTKTHYSDATLANFRALRAVVDEAAIRMGAYYIHTSFEQHLSGLNTAGDKPYIANGVNGASLDGFPIRWIPSMPAYSTAANVSKVFALFGDASYQYLGIRGDMRFDTSRDAAFATDEVLIRAIERFTIGLMATGAMAGLETAAS